MAHGVLFVLNGRYYWKIGKKGHERKRRKEREGIRKKPNQNQMSKLTTWCSVLQTT